MSAQRTTQTCAPEMTTKRQHTSEFSVTAPLRTDTWLELYRLGEVERLPKDDAAPSTLGDRR